MADSVSLTNSLDTEDLEDPVVLLSTSDPTGSNVLVIFLVDTPAKSFSNTTCSAISFDQNVFQVSIGIS